MKCSWDFSTIEEIIRNYQSIPVPCMTFFVELASLFLQVATWHIVAQFLACIHMLLTMNLHFSTFWFIKSLPTPCGKVPLVLCSSECRSCSRDPQIGAIHVLQSLQNLTKLITYPLCSVVAPLWNSIRI